MSGPVPSDYYEGTHLGVSNILEPDLPFLFSLLRRAFARFGFVGVLDAAQQQTRFHVEAGGELANGHGVSLAPARLQFRDRVARHPAPLRQLLLAHHSPPPPSPQMRKIQALLLKRHKKLAQTPQQCYSGRV